METDLFSAKGDGFIFERRNAQKGTDLFSSGAILIFEKTENKSVPFSSEKTENKSVPFFSVPFFCREGQHATLR
jgi:hypothetical protein